MDQKLVLHYPEFDLKIELTKDEAKNLERKLNVTTKGHTWLDIGDYLFSYYNGDSILPYYVITLEQYNTLNLLIYTNSIEECQKI
jgi:hypothetical protein